MKIKQTIILVALLLVAVAVNAADKFRVPVEATSTAASGNLEWTNTMKGSAFIRNIILTSTQGGSTNTYIVSINDGTDVHYLARIVSTNEPAGTANLGSSQTYPTPYQAWPLMQGYVLSVTNATHTNTFNMLMVLDADPGK